MKTQLFRGCHLIKKGESMITAKRKWEQWVFQTKGLVKLKNSMELQNPLFPHSFLSNNIPANYSNSPKIRNNEYSYATI